MERLRSQSGFGLGRGPEPARRPHNRRFNRLAKAGAGLGSREARSRVARPETFAEHKGRLSSAWTKRALCDTLEALSLEEASPQSKKEALLPVLYEHALALAEERASGLPGTARDELASTVGERVAIAIEKLDLALPPAQQATYLDRLLRHALADASRNLDPLGRGPRSLRRRYEAVLEAKAQQDGHLPGTADQERLLDELVGNKQPTLRLLVGAGMHPAEAVSHVTRADQTNPGDDAGELVATAMARRQIARAIASHPDKAVREYLFKVATGISARKPADFNRRLGPTLPSLIASLVTTGEPCELGA